MRHRLPAYFACTCVCTCFPLRMHILHTLISYISVNEYRCLSIPIFLLTHILHIILIYIYTHKCNCTCLQVLHIYVYLLTEETTFVDNSFPQFLMAPLRKLKIALGLHWVNVSCSMGTVVSDRYYLLTGIVVVGS